MQWFAAVLFVAFQAYWWLYAARKSRQAQQAESLTSRLLHGGLMGLSYAVALITFVPLGILDNRFVADISLVSWLGLAMEIAGFAFAIWARLHLGEYWSGKVMLKEGHRLIRSGPYAIVRNPIYTGVFLAMLGIAMALGEWRGLLACALFLVGIAYKMSVEESYLARQFGSEYDQYRREVRMLIPFIM